MDVESLKAWHNRERVAWLTTRSSNDPEHCETMAEFHASAIALLSAARDEGRAEGLGGEWVMVPREPTPELLMSMAMRYDHGLGVPGYYDQPIFGGENVGHARRVEMALDTMRKLHEEVVGTGFYHPDRAAFYRERLPAPPASQTQEG